MMTTETQEQRDVRELTHQFYREGLARVGLKFRGIQEGMPEWGIKPRVLFEGQHQNTLAIDVDKFTLFEALLRAKASYERFEQSPATELQR